MKGRERCFDTTWEDPQGNEHEVRVFYDISPPEPDVNWPGDLEIYAVVIEDDNIIDEISDEWLDLIKDQIAAEERADYYDRGDYLYDRMKDERMEK